MYVSVYLANEGITLLQCLPLYKIEDSSARILILFENTFMGMETSFYICRQIFTLN